MRYSLVNRLFNALFASLLIAAPAVTTVTFAHAQPDGDAEEGGGDDESGGDKAPDPDVDMPSDDDEAPTPDPEPTGEGETEGGGWGVGGTEEEGRFKPRGKTGRLKELEEDQKDDEEDEDFVPPDIGAPGYAYLDTAIGFGDITVVAQDSGATNVTPTASFVIGLGYRIGEMWNLGIRFPISTGASDGPINPFVEGARNPDAFKQIAVGAPEVSLTPHFWLGRKVRIPVGLALTLPVASGDMWPNIEERAKRGQAIVNQAAAASRGWEDRALFAYNRFGIVPSGGVIFEDDIGPGRLRLIGNMKFEIMARTGGNDAPEPPTPNDPAGRVRGVSFNWVTRAGGFYDFFDGMLSPGVRLWLAFATGHEVFGSIDPGGAQFVFEPNVTTRIPFTESKSFGMTGRLGYMLPLGGELGGASEATNASIGGLRVTAGFFFGP